MTKKIKNVISQSFPSIIILPNLIHFREKIGFKTVSGSFNLISGHLRTTLKKLKEIHRYSRYILEK